MGATLNKEMEEDEELYNKLACWCDNNSWEKGNAISGAQAKIAELEALIESLTAKVAELKAKIAELEAEVAANKKALAEATAVREKQIQEFHGGELDSVQAVENLKAAIVILSKHHGGAFPQLSFSFLALGGKAGRKDDPALWAPESRTERSFDDLMRRGGFGADVGPSTEATQKFLQQPPAALAAAAAPAQQPDDAATSGGWSSDEMAVVKRALKSASAFMQAQHGSAYYPSYSARSGEILGVLKQLKEEMEADLSGAQKEEAARAANFAELREAKTQEIEEGEKTAERKEDELAQAMNDLAEAKEDLGQQQAALSEAELFMKNLKETCSEAEANFQARKAARLTEIKAVSDTIQILTADEARDAMGGTYSFLQVSAQQQEQQQKRRRADASKILRDAAAKAHSPELAILATSVQLDAFTRVKKAIDDMIAMLKTQQADEVKKNDWCNSELHETEVSTMKTEDLKADLVAKVDDLASTIARLTSEIAAAKASIAELQVSLQRASATRQAANIDFQKTLADQVATQEVLEKALDKLATYYDKEALLQRRKQTPPVPQMEYAPSKGATGVMEMIEKLIHEAKGLQADAKKGESEEQAAYEQLVADTNASVAGLQQEVVTKTEDKAQADQDKLSAEGDLHDAVDELERLSKYTANLHAECDYVMKNFSIRQDGRASEIEALLQAKRILSGADLS